MNDTCSLCGLPVSRASMRQTLDHLLERMARGEGAWLLTLNTEMLSRFTRDPGYRDLVAQADIITADGMPLVWASRFKGADQAIAERTTGVDLVDAFLRLPQVPPYAIIGGVDPATTLRLYGDHAQQACRYLFSGKVDLSDEQVKAFAETLRAENVRMLFVALGVPKQDRLALKLRSAIPELVVTGIGGTFEILGPQGSRAPLWMQKSGLEWLYRLVKEPGRLWKRYLVHYPAGISLILKDLFLSRQ
ncbi:WecB/TagA/CpsF family glycosyltransferase [Hydrogenophaga sp.]|uniref:WecB/TagA/CpsF family glycosyltransferase n=1 Tax=Hydrogenophaga sp. TaxID=1904254 RepID=UPI0027219E1B|nr:WecB/TagA/CpsF family glycosyltransferase [Hydrogenophaga sp.]MDO8903166.1 WecB/TagA/CpsF family glycosyltransferase [Hydrogenophaga sp.]